MSLRIKRTVRRSPGASPGRVRYQHGDARLIPEELVLRRWRDRSNEPAARAQRVRYDGCRLPPGTWTLLEKWLDEGLALSDVSDADVLAPYAARSRVTDRMLRAPQLTKFAAMLGFLNGRGVLRTVTGRTRDAANPGLPDLFLYKVDASGRVHGGRFVEVKRSDRRRKRREAVSAAQKAELAFLKSLGLKAHVVYLEE